ncbi:MAG: serine protease [Nitrospirota bacterium]
MKKNLIILYAIMIVFTSTIKLEANEQEFSNIAQIGSATVLVNKNVAFITKDSNKDDANIEIKQAVVSIGTGFIVSETGYILTCAHVIDKGIGSLQVQIGNSPWQEADVVRVDKDYDIAILKLRTIPPNLPKPVILGDSRNVKQGDRVAVMGYPLRNTTPVYSSGDIRKIDNTETYVTKNPTILFEFNAQADFGSSGGPLFSQDGKIIGIDVSKYSGTEEVNWAIPIDIAKQLLNIGTKDFCEGRKDVPPRPIVELIINDKIISGEPIILEWNDTQEGTLTFSLHNITSESVPQSIENPVKSDVITR